MASEQASAILAALEARGDVQEEGKGWRTRCPNSDHEDRHPSFFLYPGRGGRCFSQCGRYWSPAELADLLGIHLPSIKQGLTLAELAAVKGLPEDFLREHGVRDNFAGTGRNRVACVAIPYPNESGEESALRKRLSLHGSNRFVWRRDDRTILYGLAFLKEIRRVGYVVLVEGETDAWTLWLHRIPALGVPGASNWQSSYASLLQGLDVYLWCEPDGGGDTLFNTVPKDLPDVRVIMAPAEAKDPSELYLLDPDHFRQRMESLLESARSASDLSADAVSERVRQSYSAARTLLEHPDPLLVLSRTLTAMGYAGDTRPADIAFIAITSRLLEAPLNLAYISPSGAGKNAAIEAVLPFFPAEAFYLVRASSPRALIYNDELFTHRTVIVLEADSLPEEGSAASAIRSLMTDGEMSYEVTEKGEDGQFHVRRIVKPGPTGLITSAIRPLGQQGSTRTLTVTISDSAEQTRAVLHAQVDRSNGVLSSPDLSAWTALQLWLQHAGEHNVAIPYAHELADRVPASAVRMRRDFAQLLIVIKTLAMLRQSQRLRDSRGWIVATLEDYESARWLLDDIFSTTASEGLTQAIRETVQLVARLSPDGEPVTEKALVEATGLAKGTISYRVKRAVEGGWLVNRSTQKGMPAQLVLGAALPGKFGLPPAADLDVRAQEPVTPSNPRTPSSQSGGAQEEIEDSGSVRTVFEPASNGPSNLRRGWEQGEFERFESPAGASPRTRTELPEQPSALPWDAFLEGEDHAAEPR